MYRFQVNNLFNFTQNSVKDFPLDVKVYDKSENNIKNDKIIENGQDVININNQNKINEAAKEKEKVIENEDKKENDISKTKSSENKNKNKINDHTNDNNLKIPSQNNSRVLSFVDSSDIDNSELSS